LIGIHGQEFTDKVFQAFITGATRTAGAMTVRTRGAAGGLAGGRLQNLALYSNNSRKEPVTVGRAT